MRLRALAIAFSLVAIASSAGVVDTMTSMPAPPAGSERKYDIATLHPEDLKSCLVDVYSIDTADALFEEERPKVEQEREELRKLRDAAKGKPSSDAAAADAELRTRTRAFNAHVAKLNSRVAYAQEARDRFSRNCKGRRYYVDEFIIVRNRLPAEVRSAIPRPETNPAK